MDPASNPDIIIVPTLTPSSLPLPPRAQEVLVDMEKVMNKATERLESQESWTKLKKIHRFPQHLREIGGPGNCYVVPSVVSIGPYHHGLRHLQETEEVKHAAAYSFCRDSGRSVKEVYGKIFSVAGDARSCYTTTTDSALSLVASMSHAEFAAMMFLDGCFLLQLMAKTRKPPFLGLFMSSGPSILKDIFMLENQIPWLVLEALMEFSPGAVDVVREWIVAMVRKYFFESQEKKVPLRILQNFRMNCQCGTEDKRYTNENSFSNEDPNSKPPHLLGLLRFIMTCAMPPQRKSEFTFGSSLSVSAVYLPQIGIQLTASKVRWFPDMNVEKKPIFGELSLSPLFLNDIVACYLVNLAALEAAEAINASCIESDGYFVSSYLSVLAMLMDREEDVHELRGKGVLCSRFSNAQTLAFFKVLGLHLRAGNNSYAIMQEIDEYMRQRPVRILVHKFVYNYHKVILAVLSIIGVLVSILKALYSLNKP